MVKYMVSKTSASEIIIQNTVKSVPFADDKPPVGVKILLGVKSLRREGTLELVHKAYFFD